MCIIEEKEIYNTSWNLADMNVLENFVRFDGKHALCDLVAPVTSCLVLC